MRKDISLNSGETTPSLRVLCPTRWTVRHTALDSILRNYKVLQSALEQIQLGCDEYAAKAHGLLTQMEKFETFFALKLASLVYSAAEQLSSNLQSVDITIQEALNGARLLIRHLKVLSDDNHFNCFYDSVCQESASLTEEPCRLRQRKLPRRFDDGSAAHQYENPKSRYRHLYFEVLELAAGEVDRRFDHEDLHTIKEIELLLLNAGNGENLDSFHPLVSSFLQNDFDLDRLKTHLSLVNDVIKEANTGSVPVRRVTNVRTISEAMNTSQIYKTMLSKCTSFLSST